MFQLELNFLQSTNEARRSYPFVTKFHK